MAGTITYDRDPCAVVKRVYYEGSSTIYEGMPVCYNFDTTTNWLGVSSFETPSTTIAEGSQNEGKFIRVENPDIDNQDWFAGVVCAGSWCGTTGPSALDIYIPNGAIVPVRASVPCVTGRTILAITDDGQELTNPLDTIPNYGSTAGASDSRPVAIAEETRALSAVTSVAITAFSDYSATVAGTVRATCTHGLSAGTTGVKITGTDDYDGEHTITYIDASYFYFTATFVATETGTMVANKDIVLARLCPNEFIHQGGQIDYELQVAAGTAAVAVNRMNLKFANTSGNQSALHYRSLFTSTAGATRGVYRFETFLEGDATGGSIYGIDNIINIDEDQTGGQEICALHLTLRSRVTDPNLSACSVLSLIHCDYIFTGAAGGALANAATIGSIFYINFDSAGTGPTHFLYCPGNGAINAQEVTGEAGHCLTLDADNRLIKIPIYVQGITYYLIAGEETALVNESD